MTLVRRSHTGNTVKHCLMVTKLMRSHSEHRTEPSTGTVNIRFSVRNLLSSVTC
jgi:hypothetical protein